jgi:hypothetical protein
LIFPREKQTQRDRPGAPGLHCKFANVVVLSTENLVAQLDCEDSTDGDKAILNKIAKVDGWCRPPSSPLFGRSSVRTAALVVSIDLANVRFESNADIRDVALHSQLARASKIFAIAYPKDLRSEYDPVVEQMEDSFRPVKRCG